MVYFIVALGAFLVGFAFSLFVVRVFGVTKDGQGLNALLRLREYHLAAVDSESDPENLVKRQRRLEASHRARLAIQRFDLD